MNEVELVKLISPEITKAVSQQLEQHGNNNAWFIVILLALALKEVWRGYQSKMKDPDGDTHREDTRRRITHIESRQSEIMEYIEDIQSNQRDMKDGLHEIKLELKKVKGV